MDWFYLALLAPAIWAIVNLIDDNLIRGLYKNPSSATIMSGIVAFLPLLSLIFLDITIPSIGVMLISLLAGFFLIASYWLYFKSLLIEMPSITITLWKLSPIFVSLLAFLFLGETLAINQYAGFILVLGASLAISATNIKKFQFSKAWYLMVFASLLTAIYAVLVKHVYSNVDFWSGFIFVSLGMGAGGVLLFTLSKEGRGFFTELNKKSKWLPLILLPNILNIIGVLIFNLAVSRGPVSLVKVIEGVHPIYVLIFSLLLYPLFPKYFREAMSKGKLKKILLMIVMILGLYLINF